MSAITFQNVRKAFGPQTVALESLNLDVDNGQLVSLLGPSGCGKTTALRILAGFEFATSGQVLVDGKDISNVPAHKRNMGMVFQSYSLFPNLTVAQNVDFGLRTRRQDKATRTKTVGEMLELVGLSEQINRFPHQLSGGQQQRVALARALAVSPQVLLLDEPLSALDAKVRTNLRDQIRRIQTEVGITTLFVTHDQEEALAISDRVAVMSNGRVEQYGTPIEVYRTPATSFVARFVGTMNHFTGTVRDDGGLDVGGVGVAVADLPGAGSQVNLMVRPEALTITAEAVGQWRGTVSNVTFQGADTVVVVRVDVLDTLVRARAEGTSVATVAIGDRVGVMADLAHAVVEPAGAAA